MTYQIPPPARACPEGMAPCLAAGPGDERGAEAQAVVPAAGGGDAADRHPAVVGAAVPRAAAAHAERASWRIYPGAAVGRGTLVVAVPIVLAPLPHVPAHIVQPQRIGQLAPHRLGLAVAIFIVPAQLLQAFAARVRVVEILAVAAPARRVLPLRLRRKAKAARAGLV
ncbi:MAG: hypothetical protein ACOYOD_16180, partial [Saprospiraceae bacterium]